MAAAREFAEFPFNSNKEYELRLGSSFNSKEGPKTAFHTIRYDFKPASVDTSKPAELVVGDSNEVTVTVPHVQDSGTTVYRGSKRPCTKEFILVVDKEKKTFTLERLESTVPQLKKIRSSTQPFKPAAKAPVAPSTATLTKQKSKNKKKQVEKNSTNLSSNSVKTATLPGSSQDNTSKTEATPLSAESGSSSSSSSSSSDSSDSEKDDNEGEEEFDERDAEKVLGLMTSMEPDTGILCKKEQGLNTLCEDLQLSESGSDSD